MAKRINEGKNRKSQNKEQERSITVEEKQNNEKRHNTNTIKKVTH